MNSINSQFLSTPDTDQIEISRDKTFYFIGYLSASFDCFLKRGAIEDCSDFSQIKLRDLYYSVNDSWHKELGSEFNIVPSYKLKSSNLYSSFLCYRNYNLDVQLDLVTGDIAGCIHEVNKVIRCSYTWGLVEIFQKEVDNYYAAGTS